MKLIGQAIAFLFAISLLGAFGFGAYLAFQYVVALFAELDPQVARVTAIGCAAALAAALLIARGVRAAVGQSRAHALREEKAATYQLFVEFWENLFRQAPARSAPLPAELAERLKLLDRLLALYGAAEVIRTHVALKDLERNERTPLDEVESLFGQALLAVRKDLGTDAPRDAARTLGRLIAPSRAAETVAVARGGEATASASSA